MSSNLVSIKLNKPSQSNSQSPNLNSTNVNFEGSSSDLLDFYNKYYSKSDRRNQNVNVNNEQRATSDRRQKERFPQFSDDIYQVQRTINNIQSVSGTIRSDIERIDQFISNNSESTKNILTVLSPVIPFRRVTSVPDKIKDKDYSGALMSLGLAATLLPEDLRDMRDAIKQLNHIVLPKKLKDLIKEKNPKIFENFINYAPKYDYKEYQVPFSFVKGSFLESLMNKYPNKLTHFIYQNDKSLYDTKLGEIVQDFLKIENADEIIIDSKVPKIVLSDGKYSIMKLPTLALKLEGSKFGKLICRAMQRTTTYGLIAVSLVSLPSIIKAFNKPKNKKDKLENCGRQTVKTVISIVTGISGIALGGSILASLGPLGSVIGMGLGCTVGSYISNKIAKSFKLDQNYS